ncbi:MAG: 3-hydroxyacyl-CoA dehydrogenase [Betaproteobacteria bacterium]|nr:MAG: 3-hydroxyacyl-CoA dehydrogenase [Betaproteobacteria bacterium]
MAKNSVAIIGGGIMGADIATSFAAAGWDAHVMSPSQKTRDALAGRVTKGLERLGADAGRAEAVKAYASLADLPWSGIELVIEAVTEDLALKHRVFAEVEALAPPDIPLASNTSGFQVTEVGKHLKTRSRVCGAHYFMPAHLVPLVEVVCAEFTDPKVAERVEAIMKAAGKVPVMVKKDIPGFLANRLQHALLREAMWLLDNGIATPEGIDAAVRYGFGFRFIACGPFMQKEMSGWDTNFYAGSAIYPSLSNASAPPQLLKDMVERGAIGMKTKQGMWSWTDEAIAREKARYEKALQAGFQILQREKQ